MPWFAPWYLRNDLGASFSQDPTTAANASRASLKAVLGRSNSSQPWLVSVSQGNQALAAGKACTLSFWAKASAERPVRVIVQDSGSPYTEFYRQTASLTPAWVRYSYTFTAPANTAGVILNFNLADAAGGVWIDEVALCQGSSTCPDPRAPEYRGVITAHSCRNHPHPHPASSTCTCHIPRTALAR